MGWQGGVKGLTEGVGGSEKAGVKRARAACAEIGAGVEARDDGWGGDRAVLAF
jgi:hypothetical protein